MQTTVTWRTSSSVRNPAIMVASAGRERVQQHHDRPVAAGVGVHEAGGRRPLELHPETPRRWAPTRDEPRFARSLVLGSGALEFVGYQGGKLGNARRDRVPHSVVADAEVLV